MINYTINGVIKLQVMVLYPSDLMQKKTHETVNKNHSLQKKSVAYWI